MSEVYYRKEDGDEYRLTPVIQWMKSNLPNDDGTLKLHQKCRKNDKEWVWRLVPGIPE